MSKKPVLGIFRFVSMLFLNIWKRYEQKNCPSFFRYVSMLFLNTWKGCEQKNCAMFFEIRKFGFVKCLKKVCGRKLSRVFSDWEVCEVWEVFKVFEKVISKKTVLGIFRFATALFLNVWKGYEQEDCPKYIQIHKYAF